MSLTLFDKIWQRHLVCEESQDTPGLLYIDLHLLHEVTSPQAFAELDRRGHAVRRPENCLATIDHSTPTLPPDSQGRRAYVSEDARRQVEVLLGNCQKHGIRVHGWDSPNRGIIHVMAPEVGAIQPGMTVVCGDSHTSTHGAFGALAFGIGTTEVGHVLASQCLLQQKPATMAVNIEGTLGEGVSAKDLALHVIGEIGVDGGTGTVIEYRGSAIRDLEMDGRMTLCNMSIECGARAGLIAPDDKTFEFLRGRPMAPTGEAWEQAQAEWRELHSDRDAKFDREVSIDARDIRPTVTYGTNPGMVTQPGGTVPAREKDASFAAELEYMGFTAGQPLDSAHVDIVFLGSCTNSRLSDLRAAAGVLRNRKVAEGTRMLVVPGSQETRRHAEAEGLDEIFLAAGAEWREPGCSMCIAMNGDFARDGELVVSTSNRNFRGRQGAGSRTILASPVTAAACAVAGRVVDPIRYLPGGEA
ncbi:MAG: 3-isopropylmalate dehydratase large subunit [Xanthomonadales bacterium]|nr:3-isopropylmalate dehydratase large subunit [Xanthomonadales bacterium]